MTSIKIHKLFIANRGEICRRIALTAKRLGLSTATITDRIVPPAFLLDVIDEFIRVPEESPALYLNIDELISLARKSRSDAIHPGFGFLSENSHFARRVLEAELVWVGPNPDAIENMASKATARSFAEKANMPCIEGLSGFPVPEDENSDFSKLTAFAKKCSYPLLIKAAYGGGGKGMRLVNNDRELKSSVLLAYSEAKNSFGNGELICERYLTEPRHVEVQILADQHGNVVALGDRDCSVQRRHQKIIEEAPAPGLTPETRKAMHEAAIRLAKAVRYDNAGTIEFMVDWTPEARGLKRQHFYFLEMNTRLQVEHPVTEEVFGLDLVEWQLKIAQGEKLPVHFSSLVPMGHAVEARLYAEDAAHNYMPAPGPVKAFVPTSGPGIRWEIGIDMVDSVSERFDPMVGKLVAKAASREKALCLLAQALKGTFFAGPISNLDLLHTLASQSDLVQGPVSTHYLNGHLKKLLKLIESEKIQWKDRAEALLSSMEKGEFGLGGASTSGTQTIKSITESAFSPTAHLSSEPSSENSPSVAFENQLNYSFNLKTKTCLGRGILPLSPEKQTPFWYAFHTSPGLKEHWLQLGGFHFSSQVKSEFDETQSASKTGSEDITAPVPGAVILVKIKEGDEVEANVTAFVLESMKMQFEVKTPRAGIIAKVNVSKGQQIQAGQLLADWKE